MNRHPDRRGISGRKLKVARKHAHDVRWFAVQPDRAPDNVRIPSKFGVPECISQNRNVRPVRLHFAFKEVPPKCRPHAESREEIRSNLFGEDVFRLAVSNQREGVTAVSGEGLHALCRFLPIQIIRIRNLRAVRTVVRLAPRFAKMKELVGFMVGQRPQQRRIDDGEDRRVGPDAES